MIFPCLPLDLAVPETTCKSIWLLAMEESGSFFRGQSACFTVKFWLFRTSQRETATIALCHLPIMVLYVMLTSLKFVMSRTAAVPKYILVR